MPEGLSPHIPESVTFSSVNDGKQEDGLPESSLEEEKKETARQEFLGKIRKSLLLELKSPDSYFNYRYFIRNNKLEGDEKLARQVKECITEVLYNKDTALVAAKAFEGDEKFNQLKAETNGGNATEASREENVAFGFMTFQLQRLSPYSFELISPEMGQWIDDLIASKIVECLQKSELARRESGPIGRSIYLVDRMENRGQKKEAYDFIKKVLDTKKLEGRNNALADGQNGIFRDLSHIERSLENDLEVEK